MRERGSSKFDLDRLLDFFLVFSSKLEKLSIDIEEDCILLKSVESSIKSLLERNLLQNLSEFRLPYNVVKVDTLRLISDLPKMRKIVNHDADESLREEARKSNMDIEYKYHECDPIS